MSPSSIQNLRVRSVILLGVCLGLSLSLSQGLPEARSEDEPQKAPEAKAVEMSGDAQLIPDAPVEVLIWSESVTRAEAARQLSSVGMARKVLDRGLRLAEGFPRLQQGRELPGLKLGGSSKKKKGGYKDHWFVVVGLCRPAPKAVRDFLSGIQPGFRSVRAEISLGMDICPEPLPEAPQLLQTRLRSGDRQIAVFQTSMSSSSEDGLKSSHFTFLLTDLKQGKLLAEKELPGEIREVAAEGPDGPEHRECKARLETTAKLIRMVRSCTDARTSCDANEQHVPRKTEERYELRPDGPGRSKLRLDRSRRILKKATCVGGAL